MPFTLGSRLKRSSYFFVFIEDVLPGFEPVPPTPADRSKSWVLSGGRKALIDFNGAPHKPGIMYTTNAKTIMDIKVRVTDRCVTPVSWANFILPIRYSPIKMPMAIHSDKNISRSNQFQ